MAYRESDVTQLFDSLVSQCKQLPNALFVTELMRKALDFYRLVPLYPGIIRACLGKIFVSDPNGKRLEAGIRAIFRQGDRHFLGTVVEFSDGMVSLHDVTILEKTDRLDISRDALIATIDENVLRNDWPSLIFDGERRS